MVDKKKSDKSKSQTCPRHYTNELSNLPPNKAKEIVERSIHLYFTDGPKFRTNDPFRKRINEFIRANMYILNHEVKQFLKKPQPNNDEHTVESIYSGMAGIALLYNFYAYKTNNKNDIRETAKQIIEKCISVVDKNSNSITYLTGKSGIYVTAAKIYKDVGDKENLKQMIENVVDLLPLALNQKMPDILLYGRAGYLYSLLLLKKFGWEDPKRDKLIRQVVASILTNGVQTCSKDKPRRTSLMFKCHNKKYLGAALGLSGVIHCLLLAKNYVTKRELHETIKPALDYLLTMRYTSGNLPSSLCSEPDHLVQWCSGASGVSHTYALAFKIFREQKYLNAAELYAEVVWKRGLLTKSNGLCHGVSGNTYCFLSLFQTTGNEKYLYRTARFIDWCITTDDQSPIPDNPYSMLEGLSGILYAMIDVHDPVQANFPGF